MIDKVRFYTHQELGPSQSLTPEGFLLVRDVKLARIGVQVYGEADGLPIKPGPDGLIHVEREADEVFKPEAIASFEGKPITDDHPEKMVTPATWREVACGHVQNVRRGEDADADWLIGDLLVTCPQLIDKIRRKRKTEISAGYDAEYDEIAPGVGRQWDIIGNHVAVVEQGRCGGTCAVKDAVQPSSMTTEIHKMAKGKRGTWFERLMLAAQTKDSKSFDEAVEEGKKVLDGDGPGGEEESEGATHVHVHLNGGAGGKTEEGGGGERDARTRDDEGGDDPYEKRFKALEDGHAAIMAKLDQMAGGVQEGDETADSRHKDEDLEAEVPPGTMDRARTAPNSILLSDAFQRTIADGEIIVPGLTLPTFDRAMDKFKTLDAICAHRRLALDTAYKNEDTKKIIDRVMGGRPFEAAKLTCDALRTTFYSVAALVRDANMAKLTRPAVATADAATAVRKKGPQTLADLNKTNAEFFAKQSV